MRRNAKRERDTRCREGRKQNRKGREQNRKGRKQSREGRARTAERLRHRKTLRVLNVQRPWARLLLTGAKKVEVRKYPLKNYMGEDLWLLETKGGHAPREFESKIIGTIRFGQDFEYADLCAFRADEHRHCIQEGSKYDWRPSSTPKLYGWVAEGLEEPDPRIRRGSRIMDRCPVDRGRIAIRIGVQIGPRIRSPEQAAAPDRVGRIGVRIGARVGSDREGAAEVESARLLGHSLPPPAKKGMIGARATSRRTTVPKDEDGCPPAVTVPQHRARE